MFEIGIFSAFLAGILSFISPCVLPLVPVYIGIMSKRAASDKTESRSSRRMYLFLNSIFFVLGFSIVFIALGSTATFLGQALKNNLNIITRVGGVLLVLFGIQYMGVFRIKFFNIEKRFKMPKAIGSGYFASFLFGIIFSFGWVPCVGMILSGILLLASQLDTLLKGILLLVSYSIGLGLPFILTSLFLSIFTKFFQKINKHMNIISIISGIFIILLGIIFITNSMTSIMGFLSRYMPFLNKINF